MEGLHNVEWNAIRSYKTFAAKHLSDKTTLSDYWAADFDPTIYDHLNLDRIDYLRLYLDELLPYVLSLERASHLRQFHYKEFIKNNFNRTEDRGHKAWRKGLNAAARDAREKYNRWTKVHENALTVCIERYEQLRKPLPSFVYDCYEPDFDATIEETKIARRPQLSKAEIKQRRIERHQQKLNREREENNAIKACIDKNKCTKRNARKWTKSLECDPSPVITFEIICSELKIYGHLPRLLPIYRTFVDTKMEIGRCRYENIKGEDKMVKKCAYAYAFALCETNNCEVFKFRLEEIMNIGRNNPLFNSNLLSYLVLFESTTINLKFPDFFAETFATLSWALTRHLSLEDFQNALLNHQFSNNFDVKIVQTICFYRSMGQLLSELLLMENILKLWDAHNDYIMINYNAGFFQYLHHGYSTVQFTLSNGKCICSPFPKYLISEHKQLHRKVFQKFRDQNKK